MAAQQGSRRIQDWPEESREAARLVIDQYGEPDDITETQLTWHRPGPWKRIVASKSFFTHNFPAPHIDAVEWLQSGKAGSATAGPDDPDSRDAGEAPLGRGDPIS